MALRTGRKNGHTIYHQIGAEPTDEDEFLGAFGDPDLAAVVVARYNDFPVLNQRLLDTEQEVVLLTQQLEHARCAAQEAQAEAGPLLTNKEKADVEAAFQRGVEHARTNMGVSKYSANRDGILRIGSAASTLETAQRELSEAVRLLSEDVDCQHDGRQITTAMQDQVCMECGANLGEQV